MFEREKERCLAGIKKCDEFLKSKTLMASKNYVASEIPPEKVVSIVKGFIYQGYGSKADNSLIIFYANAKQGFILRLVAMQEAEYAAEQ